MKMKIGIGISVATLLITLVLFLFGAPPAQQVRVEHNSGQAMMIDSSWQIHWYAFALAGCFVTGVAMSIFAGRHDKASEIS